MRTRFQYQLSTLDSIVQVSLYYLYSLHHLLLTESLLTIYMMELSPTPPRAYCTGPNTTPWHWQTVCTAYHYHNLAYIFSKASGFYIISPPPELLQTSQAIGNQDQIISRKFFQGRSVLKSLDNDSSTIMNNKWLSTDPWCTHTFTADFSLYKPFTLPYTTWTTLQLYYHLYQLLTSS